MTTAASFRTTVRTTVLAALLVLAGSAQAQVYWSGGSDEGASVLHGNAARFTDATERADSAAGRMPSQMPEPTSLAVMGRGLLASSFLRRNKNLAQQDRR